MKPPNRCNGEVKIVFQGARDALRYCRFTPLRVAAYITAASAARLSWDVTRNQPFDGGGVADYAAHAGNLTDSILGSFFGGVIAANLAPRSMQDNPSRIRAVALAGAGTVALALNTLVETRTGQSILHDAPGWVPFSQGAGRPDPIDAAYGITAGTATGLLVYSGPRNELFPEQVSTPASTLTPATQAGDLAA